LHTHLLRGVPEFFVVASDEAVVHVDHFLGQALEGSAAGPFHEHLQTRGPTRLPPGFDPEEADVHRVFDELLHPPKRAAPLPIHTTPLFPKLPPGMPFHEQGIPQLPDQPDLGPRPPFFGA